MKSYIGILTYRRLPALQTMLAGLAEHCPQYPTLVAEDCGQRDGTSDWLGAGRTSQPRPELLATEHVAEDPLRANHPNIQVLLGNRNLGVAGNSNRIIKAFLDSDSDHLCLCNDDLLVKGDFVELYARAHQDLEVGLLCYCPFDRASPAISGRPESYKWTTYPWRGYRVKMLPRFTGIMMSMTRALIDKIGYFDAEFGVFGEEHSDVTVRARMAGGIQLSGQDMNCLDIEHDLLAYQEVPTSVTGSARRRADIEASAIMQRCAQEYAYRHYYRPFRLFHPKYAGGYYQSGIACRQLAQVGYQIVGDPV